MDNNDRKNSAGGEHQAPPRRKHKKKSSGCGGAILYLIIVVGISVILSLIAIFVANDVLALVKGNEDVTFTVGKDTKISNLSKQLDEEGVINYGSVFKLFVSVTGKDRDVVAGTYLLNPEMDYEQIIRALRNADGKETVDVTIPEGYTVAQIRETLIDNAVCTAAQIDDALNNYAFKHEFLKEQLPPSKNWLEGYLFPDTYTFYKNADAVTGVVNRMLNNFDRKYDEVIKSGADELEMSASEIVTIASLVEREAQKQEEFELISGVIHNRLKNKSEFPYLQIDAAVQYAVGHTGALTKEDLEVDSPYNTYTNKGLPPGPICNPGYTALYAASHPAQHDYYYYVAMPDGSHLFAKTNNEHNSNREKAAQAFEEAKNNPPVDGEDIGEEVE